MTVISEIAKALGGLLKKFAEKAFKKVATDIALGNGERRGRTLKGLLVIIVIIVYLICVGTEVILGPVIQLTETFIEFFEEKGYTEEEMNRILADAGLLADFLEENPDFELTEENSFLMDKKTVVKVLRAVSDYNEKMDMTKTISYQYKIIEPKKPKTEEAGGTEGDVAGSVESGDANPVAASEAAGEGNATEYVETYSWEDIELSTKDIDYAPDETGENIFYMHWQPILVLCSMYIQENHKNIGTYNEVDADGESYYLSNREIQDVISLLAYEYTFYQDYTQTNTLELEFDYIEERPSGYRLYEITEGDTTIIKRVPAIAPKEISNSYLTYKYVYEPMEDGSRYLKERTCIVDAANFVRECKKLMPSFDEDLFVEIMSFLPVTEELVKYYKDFVVAKAKTGEIYTNTVTDPAICPSIGLTVSNPSGYPDDFSEKMKYGDEDNDNNKIDWDKGALEWTGKSYIVPLYPIDGWGGIYVKPGEWIVEAGNSYGNYEVYEEAMSSLTVSDGLSLEELKNLFANGGFKEKYPNSPLFESAQSITDTAQCFYDYQQSTGTSICGLLGIMRQEGGFSSAITRNGWNYFNIKATSGQAKTSYTKSNGAVVQTDFRNYKADYEGNGAGTYKTAAVNALSAQMNWINAHYWQKGQNSYYLMVWNGYNVENPQHAYEGISHSYCPPWDDQAMPYSHDSYRIVNGQTVKYWTSANDNNKGWINRCAQYRYEYYTFAKGNTK